MPASMSACLSQRLYFASLFRLTLCLSTPVSPHLSICLLACLSTPIYPCKSLHGYIYHVVACLPIYFSVPAYLRSHLSMPAWLSFSLYVYLSLPASLSVPLCLHVPACLCLSACLQPVNCACRYISHKTGQSIQYVIISNHVSPCCRQASLSISNLTPSISSSKQFHSRR